MGEVVRLRPVEEDDLPVLERVISGADSGEFTWFGWRDPLPRRRRWEENRLLTDEGGTLVVVGEADDALGVVSWRRVGTGMISWCWNIGISLLPAARGCGYGTQAQRMLARYLFAHTQANRVEAGTEVDNVAEQRALEKAGFTREGVLRGVGFRHGRWRDDVVYSVLRDEVDLDGAP